MRQPCAAQGAPSGMLPGVIGYGADGEEGVAACRWPPPATEHHRSTCPRADHRAGSPGRSGGHRGHHVYEAEPPPRGRWGDAGAPRCRTVPRNAPRGELPGPVLCAVRRRGGHLPELGCPDRCRLRGLRVLVRRGVGDGLCGCTAPRLRCPRHATSRRVDVLHGNLERLRNRSQHGARAVRRPQRGPAARAQFRRQPHRDVPRRDTGGVSVRPPGVALRAPGHLSPVRTRLRSCRCLLDRAAVRGAAVHVHAARRARHGPEPRNGGRRGWG